MVRDSIEVGSRKAEAQLPKASVWIDVHLLRASWLFVIVDGVATSHVLFPKGFGAFDTSSLAMHQVSHFVPFVQNKAIRDVSIVRYTIKAGSSKWLTPFVTICVIELLKKPKLSESNRLLEHTAHRNEHPVSCWGTCLWNDKTEAWAFASFAYGLLHWFFASHHVLWIAEAFIQFFGRKLVRKR